MVQMGNRKHLENHLSLSATCDLRCVFSSLFFLFHVLDLFAFFLLCFSSSSSFYGDRRGGGGGGGIYGLIVNFKEKKSVKQ